jgi:hypothetical protein
MEDETYLGDGLYARFDGFSIWLRAPRKNGDHVIALEPGILSALIAYAEKRQDACEAIGGRAHSVDRVDATGSLTGSFGAPLAPSGPPHGPFGDS